MTELLERTTSIQKQNNKSPTWSELTAALIIKVLEKGENRPSVNRSSLDSGRHSDHLVINNC